MHHKFQELLFLFFITIYIPLICTQTDPPIDKTSPTSFTNFHKDFSQCLCDSNTSGCTNNCCCDPECDSNKVLNWRNNNECINDEIQIQKMCSEIGSKGFSTFEDLGCIMYSNRGSIGYYYKQPNYSNLADAKSPQFHDNFDKAGPSSSSAINENSSNDYTHTKSSLAILGSGTGYSLNSPFNISNFISINSSTCTPNSNLTVNFGVNQAFICSCSQCSDLDKLVKSDTSNVSYSKYNDQSKKQNVIPIVVSEQNQSYASYALYILYSYSGLSTNPQYYVLGAKFVGQYLDSSLLSFKRFRIVWLKIDPTQVSKPPTNNFYSYFQYLWLPLRSSASRFYDYVNYGKYEMEITILGVLGMCLMMF